jgi:hypothetical protein
MRVAFSSIAWKMGSSSPDDELTMLNTSEVAACRSNASSSSRLSRATSVLSRAANAPRPLASLDLMRRFALVVFGFRGVIGLPLAVGRLFIARP